MKNTRLIAALTLYCITVGTIATLVGGLLWLIYWPVAIVTGGAICIGGGMLMDRFRQALLSGTRDAHGHEDEQP